MRENRQFYLVRYKKIDNSQLPPTKVEGLQKP